MSLKCPHCKKDAMSVSTRLWLGPARRVACENCGKYVSVSWASVIGLIPILAGFYISLVSDNLEMGIGILAIGTMVIFFMQSALDLEKR
tara:strand:- start:73 stop:339 length:267 start_codon:yes stop_codon:yes gene_type:complete